MEIKNISVLGAGSWGCTLASLLAKKGYRVKLWEYHGKLTTSLHKKKRLKTLPQLKIPKNITITSNIKDIISPELFVVAVPSFAFRKTLNLLKSQLDNTSIPLLIATKGLEISSGKTLSEIAQEELPNSKVAVLTGPSHAEEVSVEMPTAITVASKDSKFARKLQKVFFTSKFRVYTNTDIKGCEISGALKNIYAIAAGICDGLKLGDNTKAALVARALSEMSRVGVKLGGEFKTFLGLSGVGDLVVTCYSRHSRNRYLGEMLGKGYSLKNALKKMTMVAEGIYATYALQKIKRKLKIKLPIADEVYKVLKYNKDPRRSISDLMRRPLKMEN